jgi:hypothetical protein
MRELVVSVRVNADTDGQAFVNSAGASPLVPQNGTTCNDKIVVKSRASVSLALHMTSQYIPTAGNLAVLAIWYVFFLICIKNLHQCGLYGAVDNLQEITESFCPV